MSKGGRTDVGTRTQGRPSGGTRDRSRENLIEKARDAMRIRPRLEVQRREIAEHAGVTPALVSYYFPDRSNLLEQAARPVVYDFIASIEAVLNRDDRLESIFECLIIVLLNFNSEQGYILDHFVEIRRLQDKDGKIVELESVRLALMSFFQRLIAQGIVRECNPFLLQASLWGICRHIMRLQEGDLFIQDIGLADDHQQLARQIRSLLAA